MKKRILSIILICFSIFLFIGCSENKADKNNEKDNIEASSPETNNKNEENKEDNKENVEGSTTDKTVSKSLRLYFYNAVDDKNIYLSKDVSVTNGEIVTAIVNELKNPSDSYVGINPKARVSSAKIDKEASLLTVDFNDSIINGTLGGGVESSFIQSVVNTLGYNLGVSKVRITINGKGYSSGHINLGSNDYFNVSSDGWTEVK